MSDFVSELRAQLVDAAAREQARRVPRLPVVPPRVLVAVAAGAAVVVLVAIAVAGGLRDRAPVGREAAPAPKVEGRELFGGSLEPDVRYRTRRFVPALSFAVADDDWFVRTTDDPAFLSLERRRRTNAPGSESAPREFLTFLRMPEVLDPAVPGLQASVRPAPADLYAWMRNHPDLRVGPSRSTTVAGVPAQVFDVTYDFDRPAHPERCIIARGLYDRPLETTCARIAPGPGLPDGTRNRIYVLRTEPDPLLIELVAIRGGSLDAVAEAAGPVIDSLRVGVR